VHAVGVSSLTIMKIILLPHYHFCSFTLWMPTLLWMPGAVTPFAPPLHAIGYGGLLSES